jgi:homoserine O-acetyltransferase
MPPFSLRFLKYAGPLIVVWAILTVRAVGAPSSFPQPVEGDWILADFRFGSGDILPQLRIHYRTVGDPSGQPVLILHGTGGSGKAFLGDSFAGELFGAGRPLDAARYFIILPDAIGAGGSSKPSDGLKGRFPAYSYEDMVRAQYRLVTEHFHLRHLRLILGGSMGGMHAWMWGEMYPAFMDALMPLQCLPVQIAGMNRMLRRIVIDGIRSDPEWRNGQYEKEPVKGLTIAQYGSLALFGNQTALYQSAPTRAKADAAFDQRIIQGAKRADANDMLRQYEASSDYNPGPGLAAIQASVMAINTADDSVDPPELGVLEREIKRVPRGRMAIIPRGLGSTGHGSYTIGAIYKEFLAELLAGK